MTTQTKHETRDEQFARFRQNRIKIKSEILACIQNAIGADRIPQAAACGNFDRCSILPRGFDNTGYRGCEIEFRAPSNSYGYSSRPTGFASIRIAFNDRDLKTVRREMKFTSSIQTGEWSLDMEKFIGKFNEISKLFKENLEIQERARKESKAKSDRYARTRETYKEIREERKDLPRSKHYAQLDATSGGLTVKASSLTKDQATALLDLIATF
jgi:hypothetical protein